MKETTMKVEGMVCGGCENRVINALKTIKGVEEVMADHKTGIVKVMANEGILESAMKAKIEDIGFEVKED